MSSKTRQRQLEQSLSWPLRPIATFLNGDNSWLLSFPRPQDEPGDKLFYHICYEPWLFSQVRLLNKWIGNISLSGDAAICSADGVNGLVTQIEETARALAVRNGHGAASSGATDTNKQGASESYNGPVDAILLGFHFPDHTNEDTLLTFDKRIPVVASPNAAAVVRRWNHFDEVLEISHFATDTTSWKSDELHPKVFPSWLTAFRFIGQEEFYHTIAIVWSHQDDKSAKTCHESLLICPHGWPSKQESLETFLDCEPKTRKLAMLHCLKDNYMGVTTQNTYGARTGLKMYRKLDNPRYWIVTADDDLQYGGLVMRRRLKTQ